MSAEDWLPDCFDPYEYEEDVVCDHCGECGLHWAKTANGWRLFDEEGQRHYCLRKTAEASDFPKLED